MQKSLMAFVICIHTHNTAWPNPLSYRDVWWQHFLQRKPLGVRLIMMLVYVLACSTASYEAKCSDPTLIQPWFNWNRQLHTATLPFPNNTPLFKICAPYVCWYNASSLIFAVMLSYTWLPYGQKIMWKTQFKLRSLLWQTCGIGCRVEFIFFCNWSHILSSSWISPVGKFGCCRSTMK